jgi:hypothetical protein
MAFRIKGDYLAVCDCQLICPCAFDGPPTGKDGQCHGGSVFNITEGNLEGTDLSGVAVGWIYNAPGNFTGGNVRMGLIVDGKASEDQASAIEKIFKGEAGGVFEQFVPLIGEWLGMERAPVSYSGGKSPTASIGKNNLSVEIMTGPDGEPTVIKNAAMAWRAEGYNVGRGSGKVDAVGVAFDAVYGEHAEFEFSG